MDVKRHSHSKKRTIAVTKAVLRKNVENKYANNFRTRDIKRHIYSKKEK